MALCREKGYELLPASRRAACSTVSPGSRCPPGISRVCRSLCLQNTHFPPYLASGEADAQAAADWLEDIGAINDAGYAAALARHYGGKG